MRRKVLAIAAGTLLAAGACALEALRQGARAEELAWEACRNAARDFSSPLFSVESITTSDSLSRIGATRRNKGKPYAYTARGFLN
jgi:hypothetical protein